MVNGEATHFQVEFELPKVGRYQVKVPYVRRFNDSWHLKRGVAKAKEEARKFGFIKGPGTLVGWRLVKVPGARVVAVP